MRCARIGKMLAPIQDGNFPGRIDELAMHPTVKPVALISDVIKNASRRSNLVPDPFAGSGSTIIAAEKTGRQARALEIDPHYVDLIIQRWQSYTGTPALLDTTTTSFEDIAEQRQAEAKPTAVEPPPSVHTQELQR